jgi:hypothetical protein
MKTANEQTDGRGTASCGFDRNLHLTIDLLLGLVLLASGGCSYLRWGQRSYQESHSRAQEEQQNQAMPLYSGPGTVPYTK